MSESIAYLNGAFLPLSQVKLNINDAGFVWGATVTDLCRTFRHQLFRLDAHLLRFRQSCELARIPQPKTDDELAFIAQELVRHNCRLIEPQQDLILVMFATPGEIGYYLGQPGAAGDGPPTLCMHTFPVPFQRYAPLIREGARLVVPESIQQTSDLHLPRSIKHRSRLHWWMGQHEVHQKDPTAAALLLDDFGMGPGYGDYVTETAAANFLLVRDNQVVSPLRERVLGGISLMVVQELCRDLGIGFEEMPILEQDCDRADEAVLCSTPFCLAPVSSINGKPIPWPGPVFQQLIAAWNRKVGLDIWGQICGAT